MSATVWINFQFVLRVISDSWFQFDSNRTSACKLAQASTSLAAGPTEESVAGGGRVEARGPKVGVSGGPGAGEGGGVGAAAQLAQHAAQRVRGFAAEATHLLKALLAGPCR